jgi:hypothetical protein
VVIVVVVVVVVIVTMIMIMIVAVIIVLVLFVPLPLLAPFLVDHVLLVSQLFVPQSFVTLALMSTNVFRFILP